MALASVRTRLARGGLGLQVVAFQAIRCRESRAGIRHPEMAA